MADALPTVNPNPTFQTQGAPTIPQTITSDAMQPAAAVSPIQPAQTPIYDVSNLSAAFQNTAPENQAQDLTTQLEGLNNQLSGKASDINSAYQQQGYSTQTDASGNIVPVDPTMRDLQSQLTTLTNEATGLKTYNAAQDPNIAGRGVTTGGLTPYTAQNTEDIRQNALKSLNVSSLIAARNGALQHATDLVNIGIQQKYGPIQAQIDALTKNLKLIIDSPSYTNAQKQQAQAQLALQTQQQNNLDLAKANQTAAQQEVLKYANVADAQTLAQMQQASTPAEVAQIAAQHGLQQASTSPRYKSVVLKALDGSSYTKILDTQTGQWVSGAPGVTADILNSAPTPASAPVQSTIQKTPPSASGTTGSNLVDTTKAGYFTSPIASAGNLTQAAVDQAALQFATTGKMPSIGLGSTGLGGMRKTAIENRAAELGNGTNIATNAAQIKSLNASLTQQTNYLNTTQRAYNTANDNLQALTKYMQDSGAINQSSIPAINIITNAVKARVLDPGAVAGFKAAIAGLRSEYAQVLSRGGEVTDSSRSAAATLIPDNLTAAQLQQVAQRLNVEGTNAIKEAQTQVGSVQAQMNHILQPQSSTPSATASGKTFDYAGAKAAGYSDAEIQQYLASH